MPHYSFALRDGSGGIEDCAGADLRDREQVLEYAQGVVLELMRGCEMQTRPWRLDVYGEDGELVFTIPFASFDRSLDGFVPEVRRMIVDLGERRHSLMEAVHAAKTTVRESRALVARSRGKPYLASDRGERTIRER